MKHIKVYITESRTKDNRFAQASIRGIEDNTGESYSSSHPKLFKTSFVMRYPLRTVSR